VQVSGLTGVTAIAAGGATTVALLSGTVLAWGDNAFGQLGDGTTTERHAPVSIAGLPGVAAIAAGGVHTMALKAGTVWEWGYNGFGQLGDNTTTDRHTPVRGGIMPLLLD
jgi:alpha-tubulin suppressor-like RCC1 family protein